MAWTIRQITADEAACLLPLMEQVQAIHADADPDHYRADPDPGELLAFLRDWLSRDTATALVAFAPDGSTLGFLTFDIETREATWMVHAQRRGMLHTISVDRAHRRSRIGSALIEDMKACLRAQGVTRVRTGYAAFNAPSAALMRKAGLKPHHITAEGPV